MKILLSALGLCALPLLAAAQSEKGAAPLNPQSVNPQSVIRAVIIGISDYQDLAIPDLRFADRDAEAFANFLRSPAGGSLGGDQMQLLINEQATGAQLAKTMDWLIEITKEGDQVIIYFSGHGDVETKRISQSGYLLGWDAPPRVYSAGGAMKVEDFQDIVSTLSVQNKAKVVVITDACHAGKLSGNEINGAQLTGQNLAQQFANEIKILSCQPSEYSIEGEQWGGGHGAFSYHLIDGLLGLADGDRDDRVTLLEIGRYLEDHVTAEVAPQSQIPMVVGSKTERLSTVVPEILANLQKFKSGQLDVFSPTEGKGMEDEVLAGVDTTIRELYRLFKKALMDKVFLEPATACADAYYERLLAEPKMARLHSVMRRNYAAALQDDAQQAMNIWLKADVQQLECIGRSFNIESIPRQLGRAAELLGEGHYMHRSLQARKLLFEGNLLNGASINPDEPLARQCLALYQRASELEPQSPLAWHRMSLIYVNNLRQSDSAFVCAKEARKLTPNWVLPFADLGLYLSLFRKFDLAKLALQEAGKIDSLHPYVINRWANWYSLQKGLANQEKALALFEEYRQNGGSMYPCWHQTYGSTLQALGRQEAAEAELLKAISIDSTIASGWTRLGSLYNNMRRYADAERVLEKALALDSIQPTVWIDLGQTYINTLRSAEAEYALKRGLSLDSTLASGWNSLGYLYLNTGRQAEAIVVYKKTLTLDSTYAATWSNLGYLYMAAGRHTEAEASFLKSIELDSTNAITWSNLGFLYKKTGHYTEAEPASQKAVSLDTANATSWINLGHLFLLTQHYAEAEPVLQKAISLDSTRANSVRHLGMVFFKTNRPNEARQSFLKAIALNPNYAPALRCMAYLFAAEGKTDEALGYVERAIDKGSTFEQLETDEDLAPLREQTEQWKALMRKYFPDKIKD